MTTITEGRVAAIANTPQTTLPNIKAKLTKYLRTLSKAQVAALYYDWSFWARPAQLPPPGDWRYWLVLAGRGFGKTRTGAEWIRSLVQTKRAGRIALIGPTAADVRDVMIEGESGILKTSAPWMRPTYLTSKRKLVWPNGAVAFAYSADEPDRLRGPQHDALWADEMASWRYPAAWDMALVGLRLGENPRAIVTTTPKPVKFLHELVKDPATHVTKGTTFDNAKNLPKAFLKNILDRYQGSVLGAQELYAELMDTMPGVLWKPAIIDQARVNVAPDGFDKIIVAVDPAVTSSGDSDETGIIVLGKKDDHGYVLQDLSGRYPPDIWTGLVRTAVQVHKADYVVAEVNQGGELIESMLKIYAPGLKVIPLRAMKNKAARAEPIAALYAQGKIHHVGDFKLLEEQMCTADLTRHAASPDRVDALVWGLTDLFLNGVQGDVRVSVF